MNKMNKERKRLERQAEIKQNSIKRKEQVLMSSVKGCATLRMKIKEFLKELQDSPLIEDDLEIDVEFFEDATPEEKNILKAIIKGYRSLREIEKEIENSFE